MLITPITLLSEHNPENNVVKGDLFPRAPSEIPVTGDLIEVLELTKVFDGL